MRARGTRPRPFAPVERGGPFVLKGHARKQGADHDFNNLITHPAQLLCRVSRDWCRQLSSNAFRRRTRCERQ